MQISAKDSAKSLMITLFPAPLVGRYGLTNKSSLSHSQIFQILVSKALLGLPRHFWSEIPLPQLKEYEFITVLFRVS